MVAQVQEKSSLLGTSGSLPQHTAQPETHRRRHWAWVALTVLCVGAVFRHGWRAHHGHGLPKDPDAAAEHILKSTPVIVSILLVIMTYVY
jgi:hypothetical protein